MLLASRQTLKQHFCKLQIIDADENLYSLRSGTIILLSNFLYYNYSCAIVFYCSRKCLAPSLIVSLELFVLSLLPTAPPPCH